MTKKIWLWLLSFIAILFMWTTFANPIAPETYYICSMFENVEIDNYRVIVQNGTEFYEPTEYSCSQCWQRPVINHEDNEWWWRYFSDFSYSGPTQKVFLLDKSIAVEDITEDSVESRAISIWSITSTYCDRWANKTRVYKIVKDWNVYTMLDRTENYKIRQEMKNKVKQFPLFWSIAVLIETLTLFFIAKLFWKEDEISNKKLLLFWVIPTTITLPLLWFVLPLLLWNWERYVIIWEVVVVLIEMIIIKYWLHISWWKAILASVMCNLLSFAILLDYIQFHSFERGLIKIVWYILIEIIALFVIGKLLRRKDEISNKRIVLGWFLASLLSYLSLACVARAFDRWRWRADDWLIFLSAILMKVLVETVVIKYTRKISWKKAIITSILSILFFVAIVFVIRLISSFLYY